MRIFLLGATPRFTDLPGDTPETKLAKTGGNLGNQIIAYGLLQELDYEAVSWDYRIGPDAVNDQYDVVVIAAANFLFPGFDLSGMANFVQATTLPCLMVGVGAQSRDFSVHLPLPQATQRLMHLVSERSATIGVRGYYTADVLAAMGIKNVQVTGCPSYYMSCSSNLAVRSPAHNDPVKIAVNGSRDVIRHAFDPDKMRSVLRHLIGFAVRNNCDFVAQTEIDEIKCAESPTSRQNENSFRNFLHFAKDLASETELRRWVQSHTRVFWKVEEWLDAMAEYDFVIGTRFHGAVAAIQRGVPAAVICHDTRTREMCEFLGVPHYRLEEMQNIAIDRLCRDIDVDQISDRYAQIYPAYRSFLEDNRISHRLQS
jgi:hypothetical protein